MRLQITNELKLTNEKRNVRSGSFGKGPHMGSSDREVYVGETFASGEGDDGSFMHGFLHFFRDRACRKIVT